MISRARLVLSEALPWPPGLASSGSLDELLGEFPSVELTLTRDARSTGDVVVDAREWRSPSCDPCAFDELVAPRVEHGARTLDVRGRADAAPRDALEILTRYQRFVARRNAASRANVFDHVLERHRAMHDLGKPLVRADYDHALDAWQWALRLEPDATLALQLAALLHDVERLATEADARVEHRAPDYVAFKQRHARSGAQMARALLGEARADADTTEEVAWLVAHHEAPVEGAPARSSPSSPSSPSRASAPDGDAASRARALRTLNDADSLSFFSLNSPGFVDYFGLDHARRKVKYTLDRMSAEGRARLGRIRLRADVARILAEAQP